MILPLLAFALLPILQDGQDPTGTADATTGAAGAQGSAPVQGPGVAEGDGWQDFDGVALIVNHEIVTLRELNDLLVEARGQVAGTTIDEVNALLAQVAENTVTTTLQTQAGRELGIPSDAVAETVQRYLDDQRRDKTAEETEAWLREEGAEDLGVLRRDVTRELYRSFWVQGESGRGVNWGRAYRDRYVRPGQLHEAYLINQAQLSDPTTFRLQFLALPSAAWGDDETAREALEGFRADIEGGADMGALVDEFGVALRESRGITEWLPETALTDAQVRDFCSQADEGALSPVLELRSPEGELQGYQLVRVVARIQGQEAPGFGDAKLQTQLEQLIQNRWDEARLTIASDRLWRSGFVRGPSRLQILPPWVRREVQAGR